MNFTTDQVDKIVEIANKEKRKMFEECGFEWNHDISAGDVHIIIDAIEQIMPAN